MKEKKEDTDHGAKGDQADQSVRREQTEADDQGISESLEVILVQAGIDDEQEYGGDLCGTCERILDGGVFGEELCGEVCAGNVLVVGRESIAGETKGAYPEFAADVDLAKRRVSGE